MKKIQSLGLILFVLLLVAGCGSAGKNSSNNGVKAADGTTTDSTGTLASGKTIKHEMGTAILQKVPERVVYLFQGMNDIGAALEVKPVGAVESTDQKPWFQYLGDRSGIENLGEEGQPNLEKIVSLKPDLIIGTKVRHEKIYAQLQAIAPTIITADLADWKSNLRIAGEALGKEEEAAKLLSDWDERVAKFKEEMGDKLSSTEVSVIRIQRDGSVKVYLAGFPGLFMKDIGLSVPESQRVEFNGSGLDIMSKEHIPQFDADYIFDITASSLEGQENIPQLYGEWTSHPLWSELNAVKAGRYYQVDPIMWNFGAGPIAAKSMLDDLFRLLKLE
ncbi:iron-siderophore ABC transporter substrate-binding protein [Paenibacillus oenotherae]|uniref:Iron-siderophore ABC transporter substrate-binding protein n=1 Tax=Paenibacillus oenotherae TaxID=1435645 RepID=A0ABS7DCC4_9BACL|nr:iron-siderophore ABC transporter substrate-binding protein [Paenibacillus oenotherae]MBW7477551.1 iron-siderophore ABC transporter substrate-binding protein [Paenibacillus oenotherae]